MSELVVLLAGEVVGTVARQSNGTLRFSYRADYASRADATSLSTAMRVELPDHPNGVIQPWLDGLLPDSPEVRRRWGADFGVSGGSVFALLGTPVGRDCPGAVQLCPAHDADGLRERRGAMAWLDEAALEAILRDLRVDAASWLGATAAGQFSLAGAQAKVALVWDGSRWGRPTGAIPTTHIVKPAITGFADHDVNEHLSMAAARYLGLLTARTAIVEAGSERAVAIERYDRVRRDGKVVRLHQEDVCQALSIRPERKYQVDGGPGPADIVTLLRRVVADPRSAAADVDRFIDAFVFNWLIAGTDAHAKNYSLLLSGRQVRLAPLYDLASILPYGRHERSLRFAMKVGGRYDVLARTNPWPRVAHELRVDAGALVERARMLAVEAPDAFARAGRDLAGTGVVCDLIDRLATLVAARCERCLRLMA